MTALRREAAACTACDLHRNATQTVFGEGPASAEVMLVGEQPGDQEDLRGHPFVGPAGRVLAELLEEAGLDRRGVYLTNVVKHFKWKPRGKRRIHDKPSWSEIAACRPWLEAELATVRPQVLVPMGATAAQALLGRSFSVTREHGKILDSDLAPFVVATLHPSAVLRASDSASREALRRQLADDLRRIKRLLDGEPPAARSSRRSP